MCAPYAVTQFVYDVSLLSACSTSTTQMYMRKKIVCTKNQRIFFKNSTCFFIFVILFFLFVLLLLLLLLLAACNCVRTFMKTHFILIGGGGVSYRQIRYDCVVYATNRTDYWVTMEHAEQKYTKMLSVSLCLCGECTRHLHNHKHSLSIATAAAS